MNIEYIENGIYVIGLCFFIYGLIKIVFLLTLKDNKSNPSLDGPMISSSEGNEAEETYHQILYLISQNKLEKAFKILNNVIPKTETELTEELCFIESNYNVYKGEKRRSIKTHSQEGIDKGVRITRSLIAFVNYVKEEDLSSKKTTKNMVEDKKK